MDRKSVVLVAAHLPVVRRLAAAALRPAGFVVAESGDDEATLDQASDQHPDVVLIEATDPPASTLDLIQRLRHADSIPIMVMSPVATPTRIAEALDAGADDYTARPFDPSELVARVRSLIRRRGGQLRTGRRLIAGAMVDLGSRRVTRDGRSVLLSRAEWTVISLLLTNEGRVVFHDELLVAAFGPVHRGNTAKLSLSIGRLRRNLGLATWDEGPIRSVRGIGYAYDPDDTFPRFRPLRSPAERARHLP
jgi:two-component system, OmpR family, KDP operon response regulator KdpE